MPCTFKPVTEAHPQQIIKVVLTIEHSLDYCCHTVTDKKSNAKKKNPKKTKQNCCHGDISQQVSLRNTGFNCRIE